MTVAWFMEVIVLGVSILGFPQDIVEIGVFASFRTVRTKTSTTREDSLSLS